MGVGTPHVFGRCRRGSHTVAFGGSRFAKLPYQAGAQQEVRFRQPNSQHERPIETTRMTASPRRVCNGQLLAGAPPLLDKARGPPTVLSTAKPGRLANRDAETYTERLRHGAGVGDNQPWEPITKLGLRLGPLNQLPTGQHVGRVHVYLNVFIGLPAGSIPAASTSTEFSSP